MEKTNRNYLVYGGAFLVGLIMVYTIYSSIGPSNQHISEDLDSNLISPAIKKSAMKEFDVQLAKKLMDKNNDGKCDYCGMDVNLCIDSGMMECTMDPEATIGILGSSHVHADIKVYLDGERINLSDEKYFVKSAFAHVEREANDEETGNVLHIHADGVPLWLFFESLGIKIDSYNLFVNGGEEHFDTYAPKNLDKILVTTSGYEDAKNELNSITNFAKNH